MGYTPLISEIPTPQEKNYLDSALGNIKTAASYAIDSLRTPGKYLFGLPESGAAAITEQSRDTIAKTAEAVTSVVDKTVGQVFSGFKWGIILFIVILALYLIGQANAIIGPLKGAKA